MADWGGISEKGENPLHFNENFEVNVNKGRNTAVYKQRRRKNSAKTASALEVLMEFLTERECVCVCGVGECYAVMMRRTDTQTHLTQV